MSAPVPARWPTATAGGHHGLALRAPWYVGERGEFDRFDPRSGPPTIQKYDTADLVPRLLADPRDSLQFVEEDEWSVPVRRPVADTDEGRMRFATHCFARMGTRKLFQPGHDRFYAVVVEVFCDEPGLPRPAPDDDFTLGLVVRRRTFSLGLTDREIRRLARDVLRGVVDPTAPAPGLPPEADVESGTQGWLTDGAGGQGWVAVEEDGTPVPDGEWTAEKALTLQDTLTEQVLPMWRLPPPADACPATATRSLWFGLVPTYSDAHETAFDPALGVPTTPGAAHLDDRADYEIRCRALRPAARPDCPPEVYWSEATEPFRLAPFFDPEGTKNRTVSITMPDLGAVAARAGQPAGPGGLAVTTPAGSRLSFDPDDGTPTNPSPPGGAVARTCTFALELLMIVAFFVFSLFLPVVVLLFQLWWLLLLRFCLPASATSVAVLAAYFGNGGEIGDLPQRAPEPSPGQPRDADLEQLDALLGARGLGARLGTAGFDPPRAEALVHALDPAAAATPGRPPALSRPPDPLCEKDAPP